MDINLLWLCTMHPGEEQVEDSNRNWKTTIGTGINKVPKTSKLSLSPQIRSFKVTESWWMMFHGLLYLLELIKENIRLRSHVTDTQHQELSAVELEMSLEKMFLTESTRILFNSGCNTHDQQLLKIIVLKVMKTYLFLLNIDQNWSLSD